LVDLNILQEETRTVEKIQLPKIIRKIKYQKKRLKIILIPVTMVLLLVLGFFLFKPINFNQQLVSKKKKSIAVISFKNLTGDKSYDHLQQSIPNLLITSLEQSGNLKVTTRERMYDFIKQMEKEDVEFIDRDLGFELCRIYKIDFIILGSFTKAGDTFATDVKVFEVNNKTLVKSVSSDGKGVDSIIKWQIDDLTRRISRSVGIPLNKIRTTQQRITEVTTTSMGAYNYFLRGKDDYDRWWLDDAQIFFERAIKLDSTFAMAYLYLAFTYGMNTKKMRDAYEKARIFSSKATDKERLYIEAAYADEIERNPEKQFRILNLNYSRMSFI